MERFIVGNMDDVNEQFQRMGGHMLEGEASKKLLRQCMWEHKPFLGRIIEVYLYPLIIFDYYFKKIENSVIQKYDKPHMHIWFHAVHGRKLTDDEYHECIKSFTYKSVKVDANAISPIKRFIYLNQDIIFGIIFLSYMILTIPFLIWLI